MAPNATKKQQQPDPRQIVSQLPELVGTIFDQAQTSLANHKKNCVALFKIFVRCSEVVEPGKKNRDAVRYVGERAFQDTVVGCVNEVLVLKRGVGNADRVVKYLGAFVRFMNEKVVEAKEQEGGADEDEETPTTRFVARLLNYLLQGLQAKNKIVRYRCTHFISEMISHLGEIDEDTYTELRDQLIDRLNDKETFVRAHAVIALSKLVGSDEQDEMDEDAEQTILQTLLDTISSDPAPEVRRAALVNVPLLPTTLDTILSRTRDLDALTRKLVYSGVLYQPAKLAHPRQLSIAQREQIVKDGLGDREPGVRVAAAKVVCSWFDGMVADLGKKKTQRKGGEGEEEEGEEEPGLRWMGDDAGVMKGLAKFLGLFDIVGPGEAVAVDALLAVFSTRPDLPDVFVFPDDYWKELTPEMALLARIFVDHCHSSKNETRLERANLPVVTAFAFFIQDAYNQLLEVLQEQETAKLLRAAGEEDEEEGEGQGQGEEEDEVLEEELAKREVVLGELLRMALKFDFADEIGRRKLFSVVKDMLAHPQLPPGLIDKCLDVLKQIMPSERDLIRVIVEIIVELRDVDGEPEPEVEIPDDQSEVSHLSRRDKSATRKKTREDMTPRERRQADMTDIRCLMLCSSVLERVNGSFEDNSTLQGILSDLIIPSVKRKELAMREKALVSLGLCCLIAKNMALSSFQLFMSQAQNSSGTPPELRIQVFRIILDLLIMYPQEFFGRSDDISKRIVDFLLQVLENEESVQAQAILCTGICKLLLAGIVTDARVLTCLALLYISPSTSDNQELRQCLSYFFPVYAYSSPINQARLQEVFMPTFELALRMYEDLEHGQTMVTPQQFGMLMVDWTNPEKAAEIVVDKSEIKPTHANLAVDILVALYDSDRTVDEQKILCSLLNQLTIEPGLDLRSIHKLNILLSNHEDQCPFDNVPTKKIFDKFSKKVTTLFETELKGINPQEYVDDEFRDLYQKIGVDVPGEDDGGSGRRRKAKGRAVARKYRMDEDDDEEDEEEEQEDDEDEDDDASRAEDGDDKDGEEEDANSASALTPPTPKRPSRDAKPVKVEPPETTESEKHASDEENIPPSPARSVTPTKQNGVKRHHTPSVGLSSPVNRKKSRVKPPPKIDTSANSDLSDLTDLESPTTPTKAPTRTPPPPATKPAAKGRKPAAAKPAPRKAPTRATRNSAGSSSSGSAPVPVPVVAAPNPKTKAKAQTKATAKAPAPKAKAQPAARGKRGVKKEPSPVPSVQEDEDDEDEVASVLAAESDDLGGYSE